MSLVVPTIQLHDLDIPALLDVFHYAPTLKGGKPPRPLNKFMVMRSVVSTYRNQKNLCLNGRDLSSLTSTIWEAVQANPLLLDMILQKTAELKVLHGILFPNYKFQPNSNKKESKGKEKKRARDVEDDGNDDAEKVATDRQKRPRTRKATPEARSRSSSVRTTPGLSTFSDDSSCSEVQTPPPVAAAGYSEPSIASTSNTSLRAPTGIVYPKSVSTDCGLTQEEWQSVWASVNLREPTLWDDLLPLPENAPYYGY